MRSSLCVTMTWSKRAASIFCSASTLPGLVVRPMVVAPNFFAICAAASATLDDAAGSATTCPGRRFCFHTRQPHAVR